MVFRKYTDPKLYTLYKSYFLGIQQKLSQIKLKQTFWNLGTCRSDIGWVHGSIVQSEHIICIIIWCILVYKPLWKAVLEGNFHVPSWAFRMPAKPCIWCKEAWLNHRSVYLPSRQKELLSCMFPSNFAYKSKTKSCLSLLSEPTSYCQAKNNCARITVTIWFWWICATKFLDEAGRSRNLFPGNQKRTW